MPSSAVRAFSDPDAYYEAIRAQAVDGIVTARGNFRAELTRIDLHRLWMQRGYANLASVLKFASSQGRIALFFAVDPSQPVMHISGMAVAERDVVSWGLGLPRHLRSSAAFRWGAVTLPQDDLLKAGAEMGRRRRHAVPGGRLPA